MFFRLKILLLLIPILFGVKLLSITTEEFTSGISKEDLVGPIVGNQYFQYEVPNGYSPSLVPIINSTLISVSYMSSGLESLYIQIFPSYTKQYSYIGEDPLVARFEEVKDQLMYTATFSEYQDILSSRGYRGISWNWKINGSIFDYNEIELQPEPTYPIMTNDSMGDNYLFIRYTGVNLPMSEVEEYANKFKLKDGSGSSGAKQLSNPVITEKNARKIRETFDLNSLNSNWFQSDWLGTFWEKQDSSLIYHTFMGWVYAGSIKSNPENLWLYKQGLGWLWTSEESYPWLYSDKTKFWVYLNLNEEVKPKQYFDSFDDRFWPWNSFPDRSSVAIESKNIQKILTDTDKDSKSKADAIMSAIMQGL